MFFSIHPLPGVRKTFRRKALTLTFIILIASSALFSCSSRKFVKLHTPPPGIGGLYVLRPAAGAWALRDFDLVVYGFQGHFKHGLKRSLREISLSDHEYIYMELPPGYYGLELPDFEGVIKVLRIQANEVSYISVELLGGDVFSTPEPFLMELDPEQAVGHLIEGSRMSSHPRSRDGNPQAR